MRHALGFRTVLFTLLALVAFASNSLLTRFALGARAIDAATFTLLRLASGALVLTVIVRIQTGRFTGVRGRSLVGPVALFAYAAPFSFAYLRIGAAVGALVLFGVVQLTMVGYGIARGERPSALSWLGLLFASAGLAVLTVPSATRPDPWGLALMVTAGVAWAAYSLAGRKSADAVAANAWSFLASSVLGVLLALVARPDRLPSGRGVVLALVSGGVTSGLGYAIWYRALPRLSVTQAAVAQLSVPVLAALGAAGLLGERLSARLLVAGALVLGGVSLVLSARRRT
jgi:drug/metabolite transporter (DMT)-like permease